MLSLINLIICFLLSIGIWILVGCLWCPFRKFFHKNYSFFDVSFIIAYFLEQIALITLIFKYSAYTNFWASIFAVLVVTTAALQKLTSESRLKAISETTTEQKILLERASKINRKVISENKKLERTIENMQKFIEEYLEEE